MDQYYVVGNPIEHSMSPDIHHIFAKQTQQGMRYERLWVALDQFDDTMDQLKADNVCGVNITLPFKQQAFSYANQTTERARIAGAVNTLIFQSDGVTLGDNTDGIGLLRDITSHLHWDLTGQDILILGAGGAVSGILEPLLQCKPSSITIANRTPDKAKALAHAYDTVQGCSFEQLNHPYPIIINAIPFGINAAVDTLPKQMIEASSQCYDLCYAENGQTTWNRWCQAHGAKHTADGLGMLIEQAAEAFYVWRGIRPSTDDVYAQLR